MDNGWRKFFLDNTSEEGSDLLVSKRKASWQHGRTACMTGAELAHEGLRIRIETKLQGDYWQSDTFEASLRGGPAILKARRIQKNLVPEDFPLLLGRKDSLLLARGGFTWWDEKEPAPDSTQIFPRVPTSGEPWLTLEVMVAPGHFSRWYFAASRL